MEERIKRLFRKYLTNDCTKEEFEEVFRYLENTGNDPVMREQLRLIYEEETGQQPGEIFVSADGALAGLQPEQARAVPGRRRILLPVLATTILVVAGFLLWSRLAKRPAGADGKMIAAAQPRISQATQRSEYKYVLLPDSTQVWLNASSTLDFPAVFEKDARKVVLTGEAFFDVKHAEQSPFIIYTGKVSTEVLGTAFNIKAYPGQEKITVLVQKGKVKVNYAARAVALLTMGQQVSISNRDSTVRQKNINAAIPSWQDGSLSYDDYSIDDIIADLERIYNVSIVLANPAAGNIRVSTGFKRKDGIQKILEVIGELTDNEPVFENGKYIMK